jgi:hypothetical protein
MKDGCAVASMVGGAIVVVLGAAFAFLQLRYDRMIQRSQARVALHREVAGIILAHYKNQNQPPTKLADLEPYAEQFPGGYQELLDGKWTVRWGTPMGVSHRRFGNADRVLAYQARDDGSNQVIYGDGSMSQLEDDQMEDSINASNILHDIGGMYLSYLEKHKQPPGAKLDLVPYADKYPKAFAAVGDNRFVVQWGTPVSDNTIENSDTVLVCETRGISGSGFVLAADGVAYPVRSGEIFEWLKESPVAHQIARMYLRYYAEHKQAPLDLSSLERYRQDFPKGFQAVKDGSWVVNWKTEVSPDPKVNSRRLLAYDRRLHIESTSLTPPAHWAVFADNAAGRLTAYGFQNRFWEREENPRFDRD